MSKINVKGLDITVISKNDNDYLSLTDMVKDMDNNNIVIGNWLRQKNTLEFLAIWESLNNPNFKLIEFDELSKEAGLNRFTMSPKKWSETTDAIGITSKSGKNGGTYAHKDIAFHFGLWISPEFNLLLIREFQSLKEKENPLTGQIWDHKRFLTKANYALQTDAIKDVLIPLSNLPKEKEGIVYATEADLLYKAMYGYTSREWRDNNPDLVSNGRNLRDYADTHQLIVLNNLESLNAEYIRLEINADQRLVMLRRAAIEQLKSLKKSLRIEDSKIESPNVPSIKQIWNNDTKQAFPTNSPNKISSGDTDFDLKINKGIKKGKPKE